MRVLLVSSSSGSRGGGELFLVYLGEALSKLGITAALWLSADPAMDELAGLYGRFGPVLRHPYINTYRRRSRSFAHLLPAGSAGRSIVRQWRAFAPDLLHLNKQCLEDGLDLLHLASALGKPHGCTIHITQTARELAAFLGGPRDALAKWRLRAYPGPLWAIAERRAHELGQFLGRNQPVPFIPNGVRIPQLPTMAEERRRMRAQYCGGDCSGPIAVSVGRIEEQKDPLRFLEIMGAWKRVAPGLRGFWVGDGRLRDAFEARIAEMRAGDWITCLGWQPDPLPFLCMADVYVHPARFEGLPFALLEAMAHGLPCVLSPSLAHELKDIPQEIWIIAGNNEAMWLGQLQDEVQLRRHGELARRTAIDGFSIEVMAKAYLRWYEALIRDWKGSRS